MLNSYFDLDLLIRKEVLLAHFALEVLCFTLAKSSDSVLESSKVFLGFLLVSLNRSLLKQYQVCLLLVAAVASYADQLTRTITEYRTCSCLSI